MTPVRQWPAYLLKNIPDDMRTQLTDRAYAADMSVNDVIRAALCTHYRMECEPQSAVFQPGKYIGGDTILIRFHPQLYQRIKADTRNEYGAVRRLIIATLTAYLEDNA